MSTGKMHADEVDIDVPLARRLLAAQFPQWAALPIEPVASAGTENAIYRLGQDMALRIPRRYEGKLEQVEKEHRRSMTPPGRTVAALHCPSRSSPCPTTWAPTPRSWPAADTPSMKSSPITGRRSALLAASDQLSRERC